MKVFQFLKKLGHTDSYLQKTRMNVTACKLQVENGCDVPNHSTNDICLRFETISNFPKYNKHHTIQIFPILSSCGRMIRHPDILKEV